MLEPSELEPSERYGAFIKSDLIGGGGMAEVFKGISESDPSEKCAIKLIKYNCNCLNNSCDNCLAFRKRFHREQIALEKLDHSNIVKVLGVSGEDDKKPYILMEYLDGKTLDKIKSLSLEKIMLIAISVAEALNHAHSKKIIHRDIKPGNIFLLNDDKTVKLTDFGVAYMSEFPRMTEFGRPIGTRNYMSPEQERGDPVDERSDLYSFGLVLYKLITGEYFNKNNVSESSGLLRSKVDHDLNCIILRLLKEEPKERYDSALELRCSLMYSYLEVMKNKLKSINDDFQKEEKNISIIKKEYETTNGNLKKNKARLKLLNSIILSKLVVVFLIAIMLIFTILSIAMLNFYNNKEQNNDFIYKEYADYLAKSFLKKELIVAVAQDEWSEVEKTIKNYFTKQEIVKRIYIADMANVIMSSTDSDLIGKNLNKVNNNIFLLDNSKLIFFDYPIIHSVVGKIGSLHLAMESIFLQEALQKIVALLNVILVIALIIIAIGISIYYYQYILLPENLELIKTALIEVSKENFSYRIKEKSLDNSVNNDDFFQIYEIFNQMANNIEIEIKKLQIEIEEKGKNQ